MSDKHTAQWKKVELLRRHFPWRDEAKLIQNAWLIWDVPGY